MRVAAHERCERDVDFGGAINQRLIYSHHPTRHSHRRGAETDEEDDTPRTQTQPEELPLLCRWSIAKKEEKHVVCKSSAMSHELSLVAMTKAINIDNSINKSIIPIEPTRSKEINERNKSNCWVTGRQRKNPQAARFLGGKAGVGCKTPRIVSRSTFSLFGA